MTTGTEHTEIRPDFESADLKKMAKEISVMSSAEKDQQSDDSQEKVFVPAKSFSGDRKKGRGPRGTSSARPPLQGHFWRFFSPTRRGEKENKKEEAESEAMEYQQKRASFAGNRTTSEKGQIKEKRRTSFTGWSKPKPSNTKVGPLSPAALGDSLDLAIDAKEKEERKRPDTPRPGGGKFSPFSKSKSTKSEKKEGQTKKE